MRRHECVFTRRLHLSAGIACGCLVCLAVMPDAHAYGRGGGRGKSQAAQKMRQQMEAYQQDVARYQQELAAKQAEIAREFDANGDGQLRGAEKSKFEKHMREIQAGRKPNPFAGILPPGQGPAATAQRK